MAREVRACEFFGMELSADYLARFGGVARLYGERALGNFSRAHVMVVGVGGVGSWVVEGLARSGVGRLSMVDLDEICVTNVNRQLHAMDGQIGREKTEAMAERVRGISPEAKVEIFGTFFREGNGGEILASRPDVVVDAIDSLPHKTHLLAMCREMGIAVISCGAAGGRRDASRLRCVDLAEMTHDPLLNQVRKQLRTQHGFSKGSLEKRKKSKKMGIAVIFTDEAPYYPSCGGEVSREKPAREEGSMRLNCASGFGTVTHMTATMGLLAVNWVLERLARE